MLPHWSLPPICATQFFVRYRCRKSYACQVEHKSLQVSVSVICYIDETS